MSLNNQPYDAKSYDPHGAICASCGVRIDYQKEDRWVILGDKTTTHHLDCLKKECPHAD